MRKGQKCSDETRMKMSMAARGRVISDETKAKLSVALKGFRQPPEVLAKIAAATRSRKVTPETRLKLSAAFAGQPKGGRNTRGTENCFAKWWHLKSPSGVTHRFKNLMEFLRIGDHDLPEEDVAEPLRSCRAFMGLSSLRPDRRRPQGTWKGWTWVFDADLEEHLYRHNTSDR